jgi:hypothetical protein
MSHQAPEKIKGIPDNAFRELKEGEIYQPIMSPDKVYPEINVWSVVWGLVMAVVFQPRRHISGLRSVRFLKRQFLLRSLL